MNEWRHVYAIIFQAAYTLGCIQQTDSCSLVQLHLLLGHGNDFEHVCVGSFSFLIYYTLVESSVVGLMDLQKNADGRRAAVGNETFASIHLNVVVLQL